MNPVNCVGVMGAGIALGVKKRFPEVYRDYKAWCERGHMVIGKVVFHPVNTSNHDSRSYVASFPTKHHWKEASKLFDIEHGLDNFVKLYNDMFTKMGYPSKYPTTVVFPALGCGCGGLDWTDVKQLMFEKLSPENFKCKETTIVIHFPK